MAQYLGSIPARVIPKTQKMVAFEKGAFRSSSTNVANFSYLYIYMCVCVCVCARVRIDSFSKVADKYRVRKEKKE